MAVSKKAMRHSDVLGAGTRKRKHLSPDDKFDTVMAEWGRGTLHSGSGEIVRTQSQALAIAYSEMRKRRAEEARRRRNGPGS